MNQPGGALGARAPLPGRRKKLLRLNLQGKVVSAPPGRVCIPRQSKSAFFRKLGRSGRLEWLI